MSKSFTTQRLADELGGQLVGDGTIHVTRLAHPADARDVGDLALAMDAKLLPLLANGKSRVAVVAGDAEVPAGSVEACIRVARPRVVLSKLTNMFSEPVPVASGIHPTAIIEAGASIGANVTIGAQSFVGAGAVIGANSVLHPQVYIAPQAVIGENALIYSGVKVGAGVRIGARFIAHFNTSLGADGFSFVTPQTGSVEQVKADGGGEVTASNSAFLRIASLGGLVIGDDVEIGANTSIDQGTIAPTRIGNGSKIDNQVQIGHNVQIGDNCLICGRVGIAGSVTVGNRVVLGGAAGVADHVEIGDDAVIMAMSGVAGNVRPRSVVGGFPARPREQLLESYFNMSRLKSFFRKIEKIIERLDQLEKTPKE